jgi:hypothetical protein
MPPFLSMMDYYQPSSMEERMLNSIEPSRISRQIQEQVRRRKNRDARVVAVSITVMILTVSALIWHYRQSQPITGNQIATLTNLVAQAADRTGASRQRIWSDLHHRFEIRRARQLPRADFDAALDHLTRLSH